MQIAQYFIVVRYIQWMGKIPGKSALRLSDQDGELSHSMVAVVVCVRGIEERLSRNLKSILQQERCHAKLHLVVDSLQDSAMPVLSQLQQECSDRVEIHSFDISNENAGLKPLGLSQVCRELLNRSNCPQYFVFSDADTLHPTTWLIRLISHLQANNLFGAVTGQRWYMNVGSDTACEQKRNGTRVRELWNIASLPQMFFYQVVWGGSWGIKTEALRQSGLLDSWQQSLFEDTMVAACLKKIGLQVSTVPGLYSYSDDQVSLGEAGYWISRQLLDTRMYHPAFPAIAVHGLVSAMMSIFPLALISILVWQLYNQHSVAWPVAGLATIALYQVANLGIWLLLERTGRQCRAVLEMQFQEDASRPTALQRLQTLGLTQIYYPLAAIRSMLTRQIRWRGIEYRWSSPWKIQRRGYHVMNERSGRQHTEPEHS